MRGMKTQSDTQMPRTPGLLRRWLVAGLLVGLAGPTGATTTTSDTVELAELTDRADLIVDAIAADRASLWIDGTLFTAVHLEIQEVLKGESLGDITLLLPGGIDLDREIPVAIRWPGAPELGTGERSLLFLYRSREEKIRGPSKPRGRDRPNGPHYYSIVGFSQGKLEVRAEGTNLVIEGTSDSSGNRRRLSSVKAEIRSTLGLRRGETR